MSEVNSQAVSLPPGSYDVDALQKSLDKAAKGSAANYEEAVDVAIASAVTVVAESQDPREIPGYKFVEVENDIGTTETIQVYDPDLALEAGVIDKDGKVPEKFVAETSEDEPVATKTVASDAPTADKATTEDAPAPTTPAAKSSSTKE